MASDPGPDADDAAASDRDPPRRGAGRGLATSPWVWTGVVIAVVALALWVSVAVGTDYRDPEVGDVDTTAFCAVVAEQAAVRASEGGSEAILAYYARLQDVAPDAIAPTLEKLETEAASMAAELDALAASESDDPASAREQSMAVLDRFERHYAAELERFDTYVVKACGADALHGSPTGPTPSDPGPVLGPVVPGSTAG